MQWKLLSITHNFKMKRFSLRKAIGLWVLINIIAIFYQGFLTYAHQKELQEVYEHSREVLAEARLNLDTSHLSETFTEGIIPKIIEGLETAKDSTFRAEEIEVDWIKVIEYNPPTAVIKVKYFYRGYTYNRETEKITYDDPRPHRYWRIIKKKMIQENGIWKVDEAIEFVDWSG